MVFDNPAADKVAPDALRVLAQAAYKDSREWFPAVADKPFFVAACMAGEVGEVLNLLKKVERGTHRFDQSMRDDVAEELADVFIYMLAFAGCLEIDLLQEYFKKQEANAIRFAARRNLERDENATQVLPIIHHNV